MAEAAMTKFWAVHTVDGPQIPQWNMTIGAGGYPHNPNWHRFDTLEKAQEAATGFAERGMTAYVLEAISVTKPVKEVTTETLR